MYHQYCSSRENKENRVMLCLKQRTIGETHGVNCSLFHVYFLALPFMSDV